jgi:IPT/TIG domain
MKYVFPCVSAILLGHLFLLSSCNEPPEAVPYISSFEPLTGKIGETITIYGTNFSPVAEENLVNINGGTCRILSASSEKIEVIAVPGISSGIVSVTVDRLSAIAYAEFMFMAHRLDSINPKTGPSGTKVDFFGVNFTNANDDFDPIKDIRITFNGSIAAPISGYTMVNDTTRTFSTVVPEGATSGTVSVTIGAVTSSYKDDFEVIP